MMKRLLFTAVAATVLAFSQEHPPAAAGHGEAKHAEGGHAPAEGGHAEEAMPNEIWWKWANFAILAAGLGYLIGKNAGPFFKSRTQEIQSGIADATKVREEAEARASEIERRVSNLSAEVAQLRAQSKDEIAREGERVRTETEASMKKLQAQAQAEIASAGKHASHDLKAYSAKLALELAEQQLKDRMTPPVQQQLTAAFIADIQSKAGRN